MLNEISLENCAVIFIEESGFFEDLTFVRNDSYGSFRFGKQINANIIYVNDEKDIPLIDINKFKVFAENTKFNYDGKAKTPKIKAGGLIEGIDYKVTYENNVKAGKTKAKVKVKGMGFYTGETTVTFDIFKMAGGLAGETLNDSNFIYRIISEPKSAKNYGKVQVVGLRKKSLKKIGKKAFSRKGGKKIKVSVPKKMKKKYIKLFKKAKINNIRFK